MGKEEEFNIQTIMLKELFSENIDDFWSYLNDEGISLLPNTILKEGAEITEDELQKGFEQHRNKNIKDKITKELKEDTLINDLKQEMRKSLEKELEGSFIYYINKGCYSQHKHNIDEEIKTLTELLNFRRKTIIEKHGYYKL